MNLVICQNEAFRADSLHYLSELIRCPVFLMVPFCHASNNIVSSYCLGLVMIFTVEHALSATELFLLIQLSELKPLQHKDKLTDDRSSASEVAHCGVRVRPICRQIAHTAVGLLIGCLLCRAGTRLRTWH